MCRLRCLGATAGLTRSMPGKPTEQRLPLQVAYLNAVGWSTTDNCKARLYSLTLTGLSRQGPPFGKERRFAGFVLAASGML